MRLILKKVLALLLVTVLLAGMFLLPVSGDTPKTDDELIAEYHIPDNWARAALLFAVRNGLLSGKDTGLCPTDPITRAEVAAILTSLIGAKTSGDLSVFRDVDPDAWYYDSLSRAYAAGILSGGGDGTIRPGAKITRQEAVAVIARLTGLTGGMFEDLKDFQDWSKVSTWARASMMPMVRHGHIKGTAGYINPLSNITRQEFAQILYSIFTAIGSVPGSEGTFAVRADALADGTTVNGDVILCSEAPEISLCGVNISGRLVIQGSGALSLTLNNCTVSSLVLCRPATVSGSRNTVLRTVTLAAGTVGIDCTQVEAHAPTVVTGTVFSAAAVSGSVRTSGSGSIGTVFSEAVYQQAQQIRRVRIRGGCTKPFTLYRRYNEDTNSFSEPICTVPKGTQFTYFTRYEASAKIRLADGTEGVCRFYDIFIYGDKNYTDGEYPDSVKTCYVNYLADYDSETDCLIWINRWTLKMTVFFGSKGKWKPDRTFDCALGRNSAPTVENIFHVTNKTLRQEAANFYYHHVTWMGNAYAMHSRLYNYDGTFYDDSMSDTVSHGCIRLEDANAIWVYDRVPIGTAVPVY